MATKAAHAESENLTLNKSRLLNGATVNLLAGGGAGITEACVCHPLDTIKVRMQLLRNDPKVGRQGGFGSTFGHIVRNEGIVGLYRGFDAVVVGMGPKMAIRFTSFEGYKRLSSTLAGEPLSSSSTVFLSGLAAGITEAVCVVNPMEVVKIRLQAQRHAYSLASVSTVAGSGVAHLPQYRNALDAARGVAWNEGVSALWRGITLTAARQGTNQAANFTTYALLKDAAEKRRSRNGNEGPLPTYQTGVLGLVSGATGPLCNAPIDTIKTRLQNASRGTGAVTIFLRLVRDEGPWALYKGLTPRVIRVAPGQAVTFMAYEFFKRQLDGLQMY